MLSTASTRVSRASSGLPVQRPSPARRCRQPARCAAAATADLQQAAAGAGTEALFQPLTIGDVQLKHRVVMAPLTRCRAIGGVPPAITAEYYRQRATEGGLIVSEATCVSPTAHGYPCTPTLYLPESLEGWKPVVQGIHDKGGIFFMQLWHCGRASHADYQADGRPPMAPSALPIVSDMKVMSPKDYQWYEYPTPRAMEKHEITEVIASFGQAARSAVSVGADGVEIHGASGYIINQFLNSLANQRGNEYGGSIENRCRFALQVVESVCEAVGSAGRVGIRFSPFGHYLMTPDPQTYPLYTYLLSELNKFGLSYVHLVEPRTDDLPLAAFHNVSGSSARPDSLAPFRQVYGGTLIAAGGHKGASAANAVQGDHADAVAFGRYFISCPDLVRRIALGAPLNSYERDAFYTQDEKGYIDYPVLEETPEG